MEQEHTMENEMRFTGAESAALSIYPSVFRLIHLARAGLMNPESF